MSKDSNWSTHLVEIVVIVGSILLAFSIDATWDTRQESIREKEILSTVKLDLRANIEEIERVHSWYETTDSVFLSFLEATPVELSSISNDSSFAIIMALLIDATFTPFQGSLTAGNLTQIDDLDLRNALGAWLTKADDILEIGPTLLSGSQELMNLAGKSGAMLNIASALNVSLKSDPGGLDLGRLRSDDEFVNKLIAVHTVRLVVMQKVTQLSMMTNSLIEQLED